MVRDRKWRPIVDQKCCFCRVFVFLKKIMLIYKEPQWGQLLLLSGHLLVLRGWPPAPLLIKCIDDVLLPVITKMVNISLESGPFPWAWTEALVRPILKKNGLVTVFDNNRSVSNRSFISKVTERTEFLQIDNHVKKHDLYPSLQSA